MGKHRLASSSQLKGLKPRLVKKEACAPRAVQVKVPQSIYDQWMSFPSKERHAYLRKAIAQFCEENYKEEEEEE